MYLIQEALKNIFGLFYHPSDFFFSYSEHILLPGMSMPWDSHPVFGGVPCASAWNWLSIFRGITRVY
jgi:hypothetical protein